MQFRPGTDEFTPGAPYSSQGSGSSAAQPAAQQSQSRNSTYIENHIQTAQWVPIEQNQSGGMAHTGISLPTISHGNMTNHGGMSHTAMQPQLQGSIPYGSISQAGMHHGGIAHVNSAGQATISLWPHQQPGVVSGGRHFTAHERQAYYAAAQYSYAHQQASHPSAGHPVPGSYIPRINVPPHTYEVAYTPSSRQMPIIQGQIINRGGTYQLIQHPQALYNSQQQQQQQGENVEPRTHKSHHSRSKNSASKTQESQTVNSGGNAMPGSAKKRHTRSQQRNTESQPEPTLKAPPTYANGAGAGNALVTNVQDTHSSDQVAKTSENEDEAEIKRQKIKAQIEQKYALLEADSYDVKMERWMDGEEDEFCPL